MFTKCKVIQAVHLPPLSVLRDVDASGMFRDCNCLKSAQLQLVCGKEGTREIAVANLSAMFASCISLTDVVLYVKYSSRVDCTETFEHCTTLRSVDMSVKLPDVLVLTQAKNMFAHCYSLEKLVAYNMQLDDVYAVERMFHKCSSLPSATIPFRITVNAHKMKALNKDFQGIMGNILFASTDPDQPAVTVHIKCTEPLIVYKSRFLKFLRTLLVGNKGTLTQSIAICRGAYELLIVDDTQKDGKYRVQSEYDSYGQLALY